MNTHAATVAMLRHFRTDHLTDELRVVAQPFGDLATQLANTLSGPDLTVSLRKLVEAKDWALRAALPPEMALDG